MKEDNMINEQDLGKVSGGYTGSQDFEIAWGDYTASYCGVCARRKNNGVGLSYDPAVCESGKVHAAEAWAMNKGIACSAFTEPC